MAKRTAKVERATKETKIEVTLNLDDYNFGKNNIDTGIRFLDHMLELFGAHGMFRMDVFCDGDTDVDCHHSAEDIGIALGQAFREALGDMKGIKRYADILLPMDEALMQCAVDVSGRGYLEFDVGFPTEKVGGFDTELFKEFFLAFTRKAEITMHFILIKGENSHHIAESAFKAAGRVLASAVSIDERAKNKIPSTKGMLV